MSYQSEIYDALITDAGISAIVGSRVFSDVADGGTAPPYLVWQIISTVGETPHSGDREIEFPLVQLTAWATSRAAAIALADAVDTALDGETIAGDSGCTFQFQNRFPEYEPETKLFAEIIEYRCSVKSNT